MTMDQACHAAAMWRAWHRGRALALGLALVVALGACVHDRAHRRGIVAFGVITVATSALYGLPHAVDCNHGTSDDCDLASDGRAFAIGAVAGALIGAIAYHELAHVEPPPPKRPAPRRPPPPPAAP